MEAFFVIIASVLDVARYDLKIQFPHFHMPIVICDIWLSDIYRLGSHFNNRISHFGQSNVKKWDIK